MYNDGGFDQGYALLIGAGKYHYLKSTLQTAADAEAVAEILRDKNYCGYPKEQVVSLLNDEATRDRILEEMRNLTKRTSEEMTVFIFYSGHGEYDTNGEYHLTTYDTQYVLEGDEYKVRNETGVSHRELLTTLTDIRAKRILVVINACHSGEVSPVLGADRAPELTRPMPENNYRELLAAGEGCIIITACREKQYSYIGWGKRTIFGDALVDALKGHGLQSRNGYISAFDLYSSVYHRVGEELPRQTTESQRQKYGEKQEPVLTVIGGVGEFAVALFNGQSVLGEFVPHNNMPEGTGVDVVSKEQLPIKTNMVWDLISRTLPDATDLQRFVLVNYPDDFRDITGQGSFSDQVNWLINRFLHKGRLPELYWKVLAQRS